MARITGNTAILLAGFILNIILVIYAYFIVEGGSAAINQGADWPTILNEIPQTLMIIGIAIFMPYIMVWSRCRKNISIAALAGKIMLATTLLSAVLLFIVQQALSKELILDMSWVVLWSIAVYFILMPQQRPHDE
jgi:hypothetical protein